METTRDNPRAMLHPSGKKQAEQQQYGANKADFSNARSLVYQFAAPSLPGISATSSKEQSTQQQAQVTNFY